MKLLWGVGCGIAGLILLWLISYPTRYHLTSLTHTLRGDQQWDEAASKGVLSDLILSQISGGDEGRWWLHGLDGLSRLPVESIADRRDSFARLASDIPERSAEWFPGPGEVGNTYERFLRALVSEEQKNAELSREELKAFSEYQHSYSPNPGGKSSTPKGDDAASTANIIRLLRKSNNPGEAAKALLSFLVFKEFSGGLKGSTYSEPSYDEELDYDKLGSLIVAHRIAECETRFEDIAHPERTTKSLRVEVLTEAREFTLKRPWLNEALLEEHRATSFSGEQFFGNNGSLHLLPSQVVITLGPRFEAPIPADTEVLLRAWIKEGTCCKVLCNGVEHTLQPSRVFIDNHRVAGIDSAARADSFALISKLY